MAAKSGGGRYERVWDPLVCLVGVARTNVCWRCLCLVAKRHS